MVREYGEESDLTAVHLYNNKLGIVQIPTLIKKTSMYETTHGKNNACLPHRNTSLTWCH